MSVLYVKMGGWINYVSFDCVCCDCGLKIGIVLCDWVDKFECVLMCFKVYYMIVGVIDVVSFLDNGFLVELMVSFVLLFGFM